jgi:hypothetical protein
VPSSPDGALPASALLERIRPRLVPPRAVLLIDGRSGSGKTTLAAWLAPRLHARVLALEDLYPGWGGLDAAATVLADRVLPALAAGRPASWRTWDWTRDGFGPVRHEPPGGRWIVEGCGALTPGSRRFAAATIVLDVADRERRRRIVDRDPSEAMPGHARWAIQERRLLARAPRSVLADLVVPGGIRYPGDRSGVARQRPR